MSRAHDEIWERSAEMNAEELMRELVAAGDGPVEAVKLSRGSRLLLLAGWTDATMSDVWRTRWLCRWGARQDRARSRDGRVSISSGFIAVTAFTKRGVLRKAAREEAGR